MEMALWSGLYLGIWGVLIGWPIGTVLVYLGASLLRTWLERWIAYGGGDS
ncbi:MAG: hypothetical protein QM581_05400 [Pseudomonas sp.]